MSTSQPTASPEGDDSGLPKHEARRRAIDARDALSAAERDRLAEAVCARALELPELDAAATVLLAAGKRLCLPRVLGRRSMSAHQVTDPAADLVPGKWDIPEPRQGLPEVPPDEMDIVFVPGSAFDEEGDRCGYGGGFYDTYLPRTRPGTPWVALAFEAQLVQKIDCEPHDLSVTAIVTERRVIRPGLSPD